MAHYKKIFLERHASPDGDSGGGAYKYRLPNHDNDGNLVPLITAGENAAGLPVVAVMLDRDQAYAIPDPLIASKGLDRQSDDCVLTRWMVESLARASLFPVFITAPHLREQLEYWRPRGIVLPGGNFHLPHAWLGYAPKLPQDRQNLTRANASIAMLDHARKNHLPTLGICGGMQVLGGYLGAKLKWAAYIAPESEIDHHDRGTSHEITVVPGTSLMLSLHGADADGDASIPLSYATNSYHISAIAPGMTGECVVAATADDGIIEGIEPKNPWNEFVIGCQWHPEKQAAIGPADHPDVLLFSAFAAAISRCEAC